MSIVHIPPVEAETETGLILHPDAARLKYLPVQPSRDEGRELDLVNCISRRWVPALILLLAVGVVGTAWVIHHVQPSYQAEAMVYISPDLVQDRGGDAPESSYHTLVSQQVLTILHNDTLLAAIRRLKSSHIPSLNQPDQQALNQLRSSLEVRPIPDSYEIGIDATSENPEIAAAIANATAQAYVEQENRFGSLGSGGTTGALNAEKENLEKRLQAELDVRGRLAESLELINPGEGSTLPQDEVFRRMREALLVAHNQRLEAEANLANGVRPANPADPNSSPAGISTAALLKRQLELRDQIRGMLPAHPIRKQIEAELAEIDAEIQKNSSEENSAVSGGARSLRAQAEADRQIEDRLSADLADQASSIPLRARSMQEIQLSNAVIQRLQGQMGHVEEQLDDIQLRNLAGAIRVFAPAETPDKPLKNQKTKILIAVWVAAFLLSVAVPVSLELFDKRVYYASDVERALANPVVGITIRSIPKLDRFADEQLARVAGTLARAIAGEFRVRTMFISGLKRQASSKLLKDLATKLSDYGIQTRVDSDAAIVGSTRFILGDDTDAADSNRREVILINGPALLFSAEAERLASIADMTLLVIEAGLDTRADLLHCSRVLQRVKIPNLKIMMSDIEVERGGRALRNEARDYLATHQACG